MVWDFKDVLRLSGWTGLLILIMMIIIPSCFADESSETPLISGNSGQLPDYADGVLLVQSVTLTDGSAESLSAANTGIGATTAHDYSAEGFSGLTLVNLPDNMSVTEAAQYYSSQPGVQYAEPDYYRYMSVVPADPEFWRQWGLQNTGQTFKENTAPGVAGVDIKASSAWDTVTDAKKNIIAVLDTGVDYNQPDLAANIWADPATGTHGYDAITGTSDPMDENDHGTHCAGTIGAVANNGIGGSGVAWNATIMPVRWIDANGAGKLSDEIGAIGWASQHGAKVFSCSFGRRTDTPSQIERDVINKTNGLFVIAAGNSAEDNNVKPEYPASYNLSNIISVAALNSNNNLSWFSNYGNKTVHLAAPGSFVYSTVRSTYVPVPVWYDPFNNLNNWTISGNWSLDSTKFVSAPSSVKGLAGDGLNTLTTNSTFNLSGMKNPVFSYYIVGAGLGSCTLEASYNFGVSWITIDSYFLLIPEKQSFIFRQTQIPYELQGKDNVIVRFVAQRGVLNIDDFMLSNGYGSLTKANWAYMNGTSMATPMVAGSANLLWGYAPGASVTQIKQALLSSVDPVPSLKDKLITGGRLNLAAAIKSLNKEEGIPIKSGWNFVSVPKYLAKGSDTAEIFAKINSAGHSLLTYPGDATGWKKVNASDPILPLYSYWVFSLNSTVIPLKYAELVVGSSRTVSPGWNSIGGFSNTDLSAKKTLESLGDGWTYAIGFDATKQMYYEPIIRGGTGNQSDERPIRPFEGYWLYCTKNGSYQSPPQ